MSGRMEGFELDAGEIGRDVHEAIIAAGRPGGGAQLNCYFDLYRRPDFQTGMMVADPVDRAVIVFVGTRVQAAQVAVAAREVMDS